MFLLTALFPSAFSSSLANASGPSSNRLLNYQLRLTDPSGIPVADGTKNVKISFYAASTGGIPVATDCGTTGTPVGRKVVFTNGIGSVLIGETTADASHNCTNGAAPNAISATLFDNTSLFIGITVEADAEMTPRKRIVATGYSLNADKLDDLETSSTGGSNAFVPVTDGSGNLTLSQNVTVDTNTFFVDAANNRVGIRTTSPATPLHAFLATTGTVASFENGGAAIVDIYRTGHAANNGLRLHSNGGSTFSSIGNTNGTPSIWLSFGGGGGSDTNGVGFGSITDNTDVRAQVAILPAAGERAFHIQGATGQTSDLIDVSSVAAAYPDTANIGDLFKITAGGNVGISDTNPSNFKLEIGGSIGPSTDDTHDLGSNTFRWRDLYLGPATLHIGTSTSDEGTISYNTTSNALQIDTAAGGTVEIAGGSGSSGCTIDASGNFSCAGTVSGGGGGAAFVNGGNSFGAAATLGTNDNFGLNFETNGTTRLMLDVNGNVGIGTLAPVGQLHLSDGIAVAASLVTSDDIVVSRQSAPTGASQVVASATAAHRGVIKGVRSRGTLGTPTVPAADDYVLSFLGAIFDGTDTEGTAAIDFFVDGTVSNNVAPQRISFVTSATNAASRAERMVIKSSGDVGIGIASPDVRLRVEDSLSSAFGLVAKFTDSTASSGFLGIGDTTSVVNQFLPLLHGRAASTGSASRSGLKIVGDAGEDGADDQGIILQGRNNSGGALVNANILEVWDSSQASLFRIGPTGNVTSTADIAVNGGDLTTTAAVASLFNSGATTLSIGGAATTLNLAGGSGSTGCTVDASGNLACSGTITGGGSGAFVNGGNSFGAAATLGTNDNFDLNFETNNGTRMTIQADGDVGIGTTAPSKKLEVVGDIKINGGTGFTSLYHNDASGGADWEFLRVAPPGGVSPSNMTLSAQRVLKLNSAPSFGGSIGSNATGQLSWDAFNQFSLTAQTAARIPLSIIGSSGQSGNLLNVTASGGSAGGLFNIGATGNVGIGTTTPSTFKLQVAGHVGPDADDTYDLGDNTHRWRDLYLGPATIHIGTSTSDEGIITYDTSTNKLQVDSIGTVDVGSALDVNGALTVLGVTSGSTALSVPDGSFIDIGAGHQLSRVSGSGFYFNSAGRFQGQLIVNGAVINQGTYQTTGNVGMTLQSSRNDSSSSGTGAPYSLRIGQNQARTAAGQKLIGIFNDSSTYTTEVSHIDSNGYFNGGIAVAGVLSVSALATPVNATHTSTAGTLSAGTYSYRVSATNANGETLASAQTSITLGAIGGVNVNWNSVMGATGYKVYGRTAGGQLLLGTVTGTAPLTFLDDGSGTPSGALPAANSTAGVFGDLNVDSGTFFVDSANNRVGIGTTAPAEDLELHRNAGDNPVFYLSDDDVAHGMTGVVPTNVVGRMTTTDPTEGGLQITGLNDGQAGQTGALQLYGVLGNASNSNPVVVVRAGRVNGTSTDNLGGDRRPFQIQKNDASAIFTVMGNGSVGIGVGQNGSSEVDAVLDVATTDTGSRLILPGVNGRVARISGTLDKGDTGNHPLIAGLELTAPVIIGSTATITDTATLYIAGAPSTTVSGGNYAMFVDAGEARFDGNVGIGMTPAVAKLDLGGNLRTTGKPTAVLTGSIDPAASTTVTGVGTLFTTQLVVGDRITVTGETRTVTAIASDTSLTVDSAFSDNANDTSPDVLYAIHTARDSSNAFRFIISDLGNVGIGEPDPDFRLDIKDAAFPLARFRTTGAFKAAIFLDNMAGGQQSEIEFLDAGVSKYAMGKQSNNGFFFWDNANSKDIWTVPTTTGNLVLQPTSGTVSLRTVNATGPGDSFAYCHSTNGTGLDEVKDCGNTPAADYAEMYATASDVAAGDIVAMGDKQVTTDDGDTMKEFVKATVPYARGVLGVVSDPEKATDFNVIGYNIKDEDRPMPIALNGRVSALISTENGSINAGDPITASATIPGAGMKATAAGMIIGFALDSFDSTEPGKLLVFVNPGWWNGIELEENNAASGVTKLHELTVEADHDMKGFGIINIGFLRGVGDLWSIDGNGKVAAREVNAETVTAKGFAVRKTDERKTIGRGTILAGSQAAVIENPAIKENSEIFITFRKNPAGSWWLDEVHDGMFIVKTIAPVGEDATFSYLIVDVVDETTPPAPEAPAEVPASEEAGTDGDNSDEETVPVPEPEPPAEGPVPEGTGTEGTGTEPESEPEPEV